MSVARRTAADVARDARARSLIYLLRDTEYAKKKAAVGAGGMNDPKGVNSDRVKRILPG